MDPAASNLRNRLFQAFPPEVQKQLAPQYEPVDAHGVLLEAEDRPQSVYFPHHGTVVSMTRTTETGATVEIGIIGSEGVVGIQNILSVQPSGSDAIVQMAGAVSKVPLSEIRRVLDQNETVRNLLLTASMNFLHQVSQHVVCNRLHTVEQRLAKWLLSVRDRTDSDVLELTHDFLAHMLGIRRSGVTVAVGALSLDGIIAQRRVSIRIVDRNGLEERSCECYRAMRDASAP